MRPFSILTAQNIFKKMLNRTKFFVKLRSLGLKQRIIHTDNAYNQYF